MVRNRVQSRVTNLCHFGKKAEWPKKIFEHGQKIFGLLSNCANFAKPGIGQDHMFPTYIQDMVSIMDHCSSIYPAICFSSSHPCVESRNLMIWWFGIGSNLEWQICVTLAKKPNDPKNFLSMLDFCQIVPTLPNQELDRTTCSQHTSKIWFPSWIIVPEYIQQYVFHHHIHVSIIETWWYYGSE